MLDEPIPGLDHLQAVDPVAFAWLNCDLDAEDLGLTAIGDCTYAPRDRKRWRPASEGLKTIRGLIKLYRERSSQDRPEDKIRNEARMDNLVVLCQVEAVLDAAADRERRFYFAAKGYYD